MGVLSLFGRLSLNAAPFEATLKHAGLSAKGFGDTFSHHLKGALGPAALLIGVEQTVHRAIEYAEAMSILAQRLGVSTDEAQKWNFAANLSGVEAEVAAKAFQNMEKALTAAAGGDLKMTTSLKALGIAADEVKSIKIDEAMRRAAGSMANLGTESEQTTARILIFGKTASKTKVILEELAKADSLSKIGLFADEGAINSVRAYGEALKVVVTGFKSLAVKTISPGSLLSHMFGLLPAEMFPGMTKFLNRKFAGLFGHKEEAGDITRAAGETDEERLARETDLQHRITALINKTNDIRRDAQVAGFTDEEHMAMLVKEREDIFKRIATSEETRREKELDLARNELEIVKTKHALDAETFRDKRGTQLSPLTDSLRAVGRFGGEDPNSGVVRKLTGIEKELREIRRNTGRQAASGAQFPL